MEIKKLGKKGLFQNQKFVFLEALIITIIVFNVGIFFGYKLEQSRIDKINQFYLTSEIDLLDQKVQEVAFGVIDLNCAEVIEANTLFLDKVFEDAQKIQSYEDANRLSGEIIILHKRYDLLRTLFWINSISIKQKCNADYHNLVYFYDFEDPTTEQDGKQHFFSNLLGEIKQKYGSEVMLIPIAADGGLPSIDLLLKKYQIEKLPAILIDEKTKIEEVESMDGIEKYLN